ncbi:MAG TPA: aminotransferase class V-fold PLP-dependent enzyme [Steroidobacteraceae bacterium]|jgi:selenocysteine lyase/cysteine desulfurase|nr:aminotransferase class V-fold PLP-dependent enzyme [Steroidobacteraceae bacterium]
MRNLFAIADNVTYLNSASLGPRLHAVNAAGHAAVDAMAAPWQVRTADWFEDARRLRALFASLIGAPAECAALVPSVSYGIAVAARNVPVASGDNIVVINQEYPSNYYSWQRLARERGAEIRTAVARGEGSLTDAIVSAIDRRTAVVAVSNCHWTNGTLIDLPRVAAAARRHDAALVVDASQTLGAYPIDVAEVRPDFLVSVGYKWLLGPYGLGYMYVAERWHANGTPLEESWLNRRGADNFATLADYTDEYQPGAQRFNQGESAQFYLLPMALAALTQIAQWTPARVQQQLSEWTRELSAQAPALGLTCAEPSQRVGHMIGLTARGPLPPDLFSALAARDVYVGARGANIRVSPHLHSTAADLDRLVATLQELLA